MLVYGKCECFVMQMCVSCVHPVAVLKAAFCMTCSLVEDAKSTYFTNKVKESKGDQRLFHQQNIEHEERTGIGRYTYRRFGDKLFFWSSTKYLYGCY